MVENTTTEVTTGTQPATRDLINPSHPYFISPSDSPGMQLVNSSFDGKSFAGWRRGMLIALTAKNKAGFIDGSSSEPAAESEFHKAWSRANNMVISWLLNSLSREISESVIYSTTAKELWVDLEARFGQSSGAKLFQLQKELNDLVQGSSDIATYYTKIKRLWDELDSLDAFVLCLCNCTCEAKRKNIKAKQDERLVQFLMGLNDSYCGARGNILMISHLPTIANAYALLMQEEKQREMHSTAKYPSESSAFIAAEQDMNGQRPPGNNFRGQRYAVDNKKFDNTCKYCKKPGHTVDKCYKLKGFPPNFKFTKQRNFQNPVQGNFACSNEANGEKFLYNVDNGDKGKLLTQDQLNQIVQMLHQVKIGEQSNDSTAIASGNCAGPFNEEPHGPWWFTQRSLCAPV